MISLCCGRPALPSVVDGLWIVDCVHSGGTVPTYLEVYKLDLLNLSLCRQLALYLGPAQGFVLPSMKKVWDAHLLSSIISLTNEMRAMTVYHSTNHAVVGS